MSSSVDSPMPATQSMTSLLPISSGLPSQDATNDLFRVSSHLSDMKRDFAQNCILYPFLLFADSNYPVGTTSLTPVSLPEHDRQQYWATLSQLKRQIPELEGILPMLYLLFHDDGLVYNMTLAVCSTLRLITAAILKFSRSSLFNTKSTWLTRPVSKAQT